MGMPVKAGVPVLVGQLCRGSGSFDRAFTRVIKQGVQVETGIFGEDMLVEIHNDGPCTILLDSERNF